jgi:hypothetical protein
MRTIGLGKIRILGDGWAKKVLPHRSNFLKCSQKDLLLESSNPVPEVLAVVSKPDEDQVPRAEHRCGEALFTQVPD